MKKFLSPKEVSFVWDTPFHKTRISISVPDLSDREKVVGGDWGPMFSVEMDPQSCVRISYSGEGIEESKNLELPVLKIGSPMLADERERFPFYIEAPDRERAVAYQIFMDQEGKVAKVAIVDFEKKLALYEQEL